MKNKKFITLVSLLILVIVSGFVLYINYQSNQQEKAVETAKSYLRYILAEQSDKAAELLSSSENQEALDFSIIDSAEALLVIRASNKALIEMDEYFELKNVAKENGIYVIDAVSKMPDYLEIAFSLPTSDFLIDFNAAETYVERAKAEGTLPLSENDMKFYVFKEKGEFKIQFSE